MAITLIVYLTYFPSEESPHQPGVGHQLWSGMRRLTTSNRLIQRLGRSHEKLSMDPTEEAVGYQHVTGELPQSRCPRALAADGETVSACQLRPSSTVRSDVCEETWANSQTMSPTPSSIHCTAQIWARPSSVVARTPLSTEW
jgi:hypothetical protein